MAIFATSVDPALINPATFHAGIFALLSIAIVDLDFVASHQVNSRIGALRYAEFEMQFDITKLRNADQINSRSLRIIHQHPFTGRNHQMLRMARVQSHRSPNLPCACGGTPAGKIFSIEKDLGVIRGQNSRDKKECQFEDERWFHTMRLFDLKEIRSIKEKVTEVFTNA